MIDILIIVVVSLLAQLVLPWWSLAVVTFVIGFWRISSAGKAFVAGLLGVGLVWLLYAVFIHLKTDGIFTGRMSELLFKTNNAAIPLVVTSVLGGLVGGLACLAGYYVREAFSLSAGKS